MTSANSIRENQTRTLNRHSDLWEEYKTTIFENIHKDLKEYSELNPYYRTMTIDTKQIVESYPSLERAQIESCSFDKLKDDLIKLGFNIKQTGYKISIFW